MSLVNGCSDDCWDSAIDLIQSVQTDISQKTSKAIKCHQCNGSYGSLGSMRGLKTYLRVYERAEDLP